MSECAGRDDNEGCKMGEREGDDPSFPPRSPSDMISIQVGRFSTDKGFERPLQHCGPIEVPFVIRQLVCPLAIFVYSARGSTRDPLALDKPRSKIRPMSDRVEGLPPENSRQPAGGVEVMNNSPEVVEVV